MRYQGSAAYQLDYSQRSYDVPVRRSLSVHEGGGLDARSRQRAAAQTHPLARLLVVLTVTFAVLGGVRIALTTLTVDLLRDIRVAEATVEEARDTRVALRVERSALSSADRIQRIATDNYGMVYATEVETVTLPEAGADEASADAAQPADDASLGQPMA